MKLNTAEQILVGSIFLEAARCLAESVHLRYTCNAVLAAARRAGLSYGSPYEGEIRIGTRDVCDLWNKLMAPEGREFLLVTDFEGRLPGYVPDHRVPARVRNHRILALLSAYEFIRHAPADEELF